MAKQKQGYSIDMLNGSLWNKILLFALPLMLSSVLQLVVPTQTVRPPAALRAFIVSAASFVTVINSVCIRWSEIFSSFTGRKVPRPI